MLEGSRNEAAMSSTVVWLGSTAALWVICTVAYTAIEALVHDYRTRFAIMVVAGSAVGALASAFGYTFLILALILFAQLFLMRRKFLHMINNDKRTVSKYVAPSMALVVAATVGSYVFSIEVCEGVSSCHRVFFERIYTPPHLVPPTLAN